VDITHPDITHMSTDNPLLQLHTIGQSIWLDYIDRELFADGSLQDLITGDGLAGLTSNPAIFEKAIAGSDHYTDAIATLARQKLDAEQMYEHLVIEDVQDAADLLAPVYAESECRDGYVSLEVSPLLADGTDATIFEARRLWKKVSRPNLMIKVPGTRAGIPAVRQLIREGINVNVTLLFSVGRYVEAAQAYQEGLAQRLQDGNPVEAVASVASFFLSRIDSKIDNVLAQMKDTSAADTLQGEAAIASAALAYRQYEELYGGPQWADLAAKGARTQRLLWASTSTKNPDYSDIKYVEAVVFADTVNTLPLKTLTAYREHGQPRLQDHVAAADHGLRVMKGLAELGINVAQMDDELEREGIHKFVQPYQKLLTTIDAARRDAAVG
jgi:transaldolase